MKKEPKFLLRKAIESLIIAVEHFNRPSDRGRVSAVLILLDHSFEMLLKASIVHRGGSIAEPKRPGMTVGFDKMLNRACSDGTIQFIDNNQADFLRTLNTLRDGEQHHYVDVPEETLYLLAQGGFTLFRDIMNSVFGKDLHIELPERVLPISTIPPSDITIVFDKEIDVIKGLLKKRRRFEANARIRALAIIDGAFQGRSEQPTPASIRKVATQLSESRPMDLIFPGVANLEITSAGYGPSLDLRLTKKSGAPVYMYSDEEDEVTAAAVKVVDKSKIFKISHPDLANKAGLTTARCSAVIWKLCLKDDDDCYFEFELGRSKRGGYSYKAVERIRTTIESVSIDEIWAAYRARGK